MKLVDLTEFYSQRGGGVRTHLTQKAAAAARRGHAHLVVAPGPRGADDPGVRYVPGPSLPYDPTYHLLWRVGALRRIVRAERPDVLEIHSPYVAAIGALAAARRDFGIRTFVWHSDFIDTYLRGGLERRLGAVLGGRAPRAADAVVEPLWAWVRTIAAACDLTVCGSRWQRDKLRAHGVARVEHLPFGIEDGRFSPALRSEAKRAELLAGRTGPLVLAIGRLAVEKRWDVVLEAYARLATQHPGATLVVLGDGPERAMMQAQVRGRDDVRFLGFDRDRERLAVTLASGDLLLHGCPFETFGLGVAEAIASGLPVVVPDAGGAAEQAPPESAAMYPAGDAEACAAAALELLAAPREALRERAAAAARRVPSVETHFQALFDRYAALLAGR